MAGTLVRYKPALGAKPLRVHRGFADKYRDSAFPNYHFIRFELQGDRLKAQMVRLTDYEADMPHTWAVKDEFDIRALGQ